MLDLKENIKGLLKRNALVCKENTTLRNAELENLYVSQDAPLFSAFQLQFLLSIAFSLNIHIHKSFDQTTHNLRNF